MVPLKSTAYYVMYTVKFISNIALSRCKYVYLILLPVFIFGISGAISVYRMESLLQKTKHT